MRSLRLLTLNPDNDPMWVRLYVYPLPEGWAAAILADGALPPEPGSLPGMAFFGETPEDGERLALEYLGEGVSQN